MLDDTSLSDVLVLAQACEDLARASLHCAQAEYEDGALARSDFDDAFDDYDRAMQRARDLYITASHQLTTQIAGAATVMALTAETKELCASLANLKKTEHALTIAFGVVTAVAAVTAAVLIPGIATSEAAAKAANDLRKTITG
ncbi:MAG TPA: hypothetical protein VGM88_13245 [Kofleriaceae bacterium]